MSKFFHCRTWLLTAGLLALYGCQPQTGSPSASASVTGAPVSSSPLRILGGAYRASANDVLKVTIYGEPDLSGEYSVGPDGKIALPLAGAVPVAGQSLEQLPETIAAVYRDGYLIDPKVSVELKGHR